MVLDLRFSDWNHPDLDGKLKAMSPFNVSTTTCALLVGLSASISTAQGAGPSSGSALNVEKSATYFSQIDEDLTIRRVGVLPSVDNVDGIYARPVETQLIQLVKSSHRWDFVETTLSGTAPALVELEENPAEVQRLTQTTEADAFIGAAISRNQNGLSVRLDLFLKKDGKVLSQELLPNTARTDLAELRVQINDMYKKLIGRIPYEGLILSRQQNRVTINLGKSDGLVKDQTITAVQIIGVNRHPRFNFIVSTEKEILGRIKILKVDDTLSFGAITTEKERGAIRRLAKVSSLEPVSYPEPVDIEKKTPGDLGARPDAHVTFGDNPKEWLPVKPPSFGSVGVKLGLGSFNSSVNLAAVGALEAKSAIYPSLGVHGELWITPEWIVRADILQGVISTDNPRSGSSPGNLNHSLSRYSLEFGYNFLLRDDFFGPKIFVTIGYSTYKMYVDDSNPRALTTTTYAGTLLGLGGSLPVTDDRLWYMGGKLNFYLFPTLDETPVTSGGSPKSSINDFSLYVERTIGVNLRAVGSIDFALYSTSFSGHGSRQNAFGGPENATTLSHHHTSLSAGLLYMF